MEFKAYFWPKTLRARLLLLIVPLIGLAIAFADLFLTQSGRGAILAEKQRYLLGATRILQHHLTEQGGYSELERRAGPQPLRALNAALSPVTEEVANSFIGIGVGYYHRRLNAILTYGPGREQGAHVGQSIPADHPGRTVMSSGQPAVVTGQFVRGNIMNAMTPIIENGEVVGYIWANELIDDIEKTVAQMRDAVLLFSLVALLISLALAYFIVTRLTGDVSVIKAGLTTIGEDLSQRLPPLDGETGDIAAAINQMAQSLFDAQQKERDMAQEALRQREETLRTAIEAIDEAFVLYDPDDRLVYCNEKYYQMLPQAREFVIPGRTYAEIIQSFIAHGLLPQPMAPGANLPAELIALHRSGEGHFELQTADGRWMRMIDRKAATGHIIGFRIDITNLKRATETAEAANRKLEELANRDSLTGLFNRRYIDHQTDTAWTEACAQKTSIALLMIDVDNFKKYNDRYGHPQGDQCLCSIAETIAATVAAAVTAGNIPQGFAARYGGEEFIVITTGASHAAHAELATAIAEAIRALDIPHTDNRGHGIATVSLGCAYVEHAAGSLAELFRRADSLLYRAKERGRNRVELE